MYEAGSTGSEMMVWAKGVVWYVNGLNTFQTLQKISLCLGLSVSVSVSVSVSLSFSLSLSLSLSLGVKYHVTNSSWFLCITQLFLLHADNIVVTMQWLNLLLQGWSQAEVLLGSQGDTDTW